MKQRNNHIDLSVEGNPALNHNYSYFQAAHKGEPLHSKVDKSHKLSSIIKCKFILPN